MNQQEFKKKLEERQKKLNKAVDLLSSGCLMNQLMFKTCLDDVMKKPFHLLCENIPDKEGFTLGLSGNRLQLFYAIAVILSQDGEEKFYDYLTGVISAAEMINAGAISKTKVLEPNSAEELKVYEELMRKNPEEIDKIKDKMTK